MLIVVSVPVRAGNLLCFRAYNRNMLIEGMFAALTTPFYSDERVYFRKLEANVARYSRTLLAGMVALGSTGEAVALDDEESREVLRTVADAAAPEKVLIAGVGQESVKSTVEMAEVAARFGFDAVLVRTPTYYSPQMSPESVLTLLPQRCRPVAVAGAALQHSPVCSVRYPSANGCGACTAPEHHRYQGFQWQP